MRDHTQQKVVLVADCGINHNGDIENVFRLIDICHQHGIDYFKMQKRTPMQCVPESQWGIERETPWGRMAYIDYRERMEFGEDDYGRIAEYCDEVGQKWFMSVWDTDALEFAASFEPEFIKIPSAKVTDKKLLEQAKGTGIPLIISSGGCDRGMVGEAMRLLRGSVHCIMHCTSTYPCKPEEVNLNVLKAYKRQFPLSIIGFSNHVPSIVPLVAAAALGAGMLEFHITLDRAMWGTDHASSFEPSGVERISRYIRSLEKMMGSGVKTYYDSEKPVMAKLRG